MNKQWYNANQAWQKRQVDEAFFYLTWYACWPGPLLLVLGVLLGGHKGWADHSPAPDGPGKSGPSNTGSTGTKIAPIAAESLIATADDTSYPLRCKCGIDIPVRRAMAGLSIKCNCGRTVYVPSLRQLKQERSRLGATSQKSITKPAATAKSRKPALTVGLSLAIFLPLTPVILLACSPPQGRGDDQRDSS